MMDSKQIARFWANVDRCNPAPDACWTWGRSKNRKGYGNVGLFEGGRWSSQLAHRMAWYIHTGEKPGDSLVMHTCDNPGCCNPDHLRLGTNSDNMADMVSKGRARRPVGAINPAAKLTAGDVDEIRRLYSLGGFTHADLAEMFDMGKSQIGNITSGRGWAA